MAQPSASERLRLLQTVELRRVNEEISRLEEALHTAQLERQKVYQEVRSLQDLVAQEELQELHRAHQEMLQKKRQELLSSEHTQAMPDSTEYLNEEKKESQTIVDFNREHTPLDQTLQAEPTTANSEMSFPSQSFEPEKHSSSHNNSASTQQLFETTAAARSGTPASRNARLSSGRSPLLFLKRATSLPSPNEGPLPAPVPLAHPLQSRPPGNPAHPSGKAGQRSLRPETEKDLLEVLMQQDAEVDLLADEESLEADEDIVAGLSRRDAEDSSSSSSIGVDAFLPVTNRQTSCGSAVQQSSRRSKREFQSARADCSDEEEEEDLLHTQRSQRHPADITVEEELEGGGGEQPPPDVWKTQKPFQKSGVEGFKASYHHPFEEDDREAAQSMLGEEDDDVGEWRDSGAFHVATTREEEEEEGLLGAMSPILPASFILTGQSGDHQHDGAAVGTRSPPTPAAVAPSQGQPATAFTAEPQRSPMYEEGRAAASRFAVSSSAVGAPHEGDNASSSSAAKPKRKPLPGPPRGASVLAPALEEEDVKAEEFERHYDRMANVFADCLGRGEEGYLRMWHRLGGSAGWAARMRPWELTLLLSREKTDIAEFRVGVPSEERGGIPDQTKPIPEDEVVGFFTHFLSRLPRLEYVALFYAPLCPFDWDALQEVEEPFPSLKVLNLRWTRVKGSDLVHSVETFKRLNMSSLRATNAMVDYGMYQNYGTLAKQCKRKLMMY